MKKAILSVTGMIGYFLAFHTSAYADVFGISRVQSGIIGYQGEDVGGSLQAMLSYILSFLALFALIYIMWAGFKIMTATGDEEKVKKAKGTILYVAIGILIIFFAWQIVLFTMEILNH